MARLCRRPQSPRGTWPGGTAHAWQALRAFGTEGRGFESFPARQPLLPAVGRSEEGRWVERYGFVEHTVGRDDGDSLEDGRASRTRKCRKVIRERPGLAPAALFHLIGNSVSLCLAADAAGLSQRSGYDRLFGTLRAALADAVSKGSRLLLATSLQTLLA